MRRLSPGLRKLSTLEPQGYPSDHELDRIGDFGEPLIQPPLLVAEVSAQLRPGRYSGA